MDAGNGQGPASQRGLQDGVWGLVGLLSLELGATRVYSRPNLCPLWQQPQDMDAHAKNRQFG